MTINNEQNKEDLELSSRDIQLLSSSDGLSAFFAKLGYNTNARVKQTVSAMGISSPDLITGIKTVERLVREELIPFEIYLFELKSVTVMRRQALLKYFRDRPGDNLLILTDDFQRLDFVLLEKKLSDDKNVTSTSEATMANVFGAVARPKLIVRPRILTVERMNPSPVALRVLRRFTYTESDMLYQYDKLLSAYEVADWSETYFNNRALFSDYYLNIRLPDRPEWKDTNATRVYRELRHQYLDVREEFSNKPDQFVRESLIESVLKTLGFIPQRINRNFGKLRVIA